MRDISVLTTSEIPHDAWLRLLESYAAAKAQRVTHTAAESVIGQGRQVLYVRNLPPKNNAYYNEEERTDLEQQLGGAIKSYVSIHFTGSDSVKELALDLARRIQETWGGSLDYGGMGGGLGAPPPNLIT